MKKQRRSADKRGIQFFAFMRKPEFQNNLLPFG
jgi:hypothetical protein